MSTPVDQLPDIEPEHPPVSRSASKYVLLQRGWQALSGIATLFWLTHTLSVSEQGWYYAFISLAAFYVVLDFGLSALLVQVVAREFLGLRWTADGDVAGRNQARFHALCHQVAGWYAAAALVYLALIPIGLFFFASRGVSLGYDWRWAWALTVIATAFNQAMSPCAVMLEGGGRIREAYGLRLLQSLMGAALLWFGLFAGVGIYAPAIAPLCAGLVTLAWASSRLRPLARAALRADRRRFDWRLEIAPLQWRMGVSFTCSYLLSQIHVPLLFRTQGAEAAARMGLSLTIATMLSLLAQSWVTSRIPNLTQLAGQHRWAEMDHTFQRGFQFAVAAYAGAALLAIIVRHVLIGTAFDSRLLPDLEFAALMLAGLAAHITTLLASQVRTYQRDPFVIHSIITAIAVTLGALFAAPRWSTAGVVGVLLIVNFGFQLPWVGWLYRRCNRRWRLQSSS